MKSLGNLANELFKNDAGNLNPLGKAIKILAIFITIRILLSIINKLVDKTFKSRKGTHLLDSKRANTLGQVLKKIIKYILYFMGIMVVLEMFSINTTSILATAGIGGLAIGFGAQSLVKDIITGFFILLEDQYSVGDLVQIGDYQGVVEELGLRITKLRDFSGELHIIPNSSIQIVTNKTRGPMRALVKIPIAYEENIDRIIMILKKTCNEIKETNKSFVEGPSILAITNLGESNMEITIVAKVNAGEQWAVEREIRKKVKETFDSEGIKIPYPKRIIYGGKEL